MIAHLPKFKLNSNYSELRNSHCARYRFKTSVDNELILCDDLAIEATISFRDNNDHEWMNLDGNKLTLRKDYAWNGCTPKICLFGVWVGTPDFEENIQASAWHDAMAQFFSTRHFPFSKQQVDLIFYKIMKLNNFDFAGIYYNAVKKFGNYRSNNNENSYLTHQLKFCL